MDAFGNLTSVVELDPSIGNVTTNYTYDVLNHLTAVSMPRGATTQTRTFNYTSSNVVGGFLLSATNPENGTVTYTYNTGTNTLASKTDAKGQQLTYQYDGYNRLTSVSGYTTPPCPNCVPPITGVGEVLRTYTYDTATNGLGRLAGVTYATLDTVQITESYAYVAAGTPGGGLPASKSIGVSEPYEYQNAMGDYEHVNVGGGLTATYTYNGLGKITAVTYPSTVATGGTATAGPTYNYSYDSMYRLSGMTQTTTPTTTIVSNVSYNAANQLLTMNYPGYEETRSYNTLGQLTNLNVENTSYASVENLTYNYPSGTNNGKVSSMYNAVSGETIAYAYDSLNRIATAGGSGWGQQYGFDPFGNLTSKTVTSGSGPSLSVSINPANNQLEGVSGYTYDANGNMSLGTGTLAYDVENRISVAASGASTVSYAYDSQNRRVWSWPGTKDSLGNVTGYTLNLYSPTGLKLGAYTFAPAVNGSYEPYMAVMLVSSDQYFGSRRLAVLDQLGSVGTYYPWGENRGSTDPQNTWSFATYWEDSVTGLDYANNRYYSNAYGRFMTPDPYQASGGPSDPQSWNRYAYTRGDPVNRFDPGGLDDCPAGSAPGPNGDGTVCLEETLGPGSGSGEGNQLEQEKNQHAGPVQTFGAATFKITVTGYTRTGANENTITDDLNDILNQVLTGGCARWLTGQDFSASQLIAAMETAVSGGPSYGYGVLNNNNTAAFVGTTNTDGTPIAGLPADASITVNTNGAFFNSAYTVGSGFIQYTGGTLQAQIFILIHELAHEVGAAGFLPDAGNQANVNSNNALVQKNCGSQIAGVH